MITIKEFIKNTVDYLESKKISDIKFTTDTLTPYDGEIQKEKENRVYLNLVKYNKIRIINPTLPPLSSAIYICRDTFEPKIDHFLDFIDGLEDTIQILLAESPNGKIEVIGIELNNRDIPLEFIRTNDTDPSIISLTTTRELGKETKAEPFTL